MTRRRPGPRVDCGETRHGPHNSLARHYHGADPQFLRFDPQKYRIERDEYRTWIDRVLGDQRFPELRAASFALLYFVAGFLLAAAFSIGRLYISSLPIYLGAFGIAWVLSVYRRGSRKIPDIFNALRPCFLVSDDVYATEVRRWFREFTDESANNLWGACVIAFACVAAFIALYYQGRLGPYKIAALHLATFPPEWYMPDHRAGKLLVLFWYALAVGLLVGTTGRLLLKNCWFLLKLRRWPVVPVAFIVRLRLRRAADFYLYVASVWLIGVMLFVIMFHRTIDPTTLAMIAALGFVELAVLLTPQVVFRQYLQRSSRLAECLRLYAKSRSVGIPFPEVVEALKPLGSFGHSFDLPRLASIADEVSDTNVWVYDGEQLGKAAALQALTFSPLFVPLALQAVRPMFGS